jgi:hypothetical protein
MVYEWIRCFPVVLFKRFAGVRPDTFATMVDLLRAHHVRTHRKPGRPPKLSVENQLLLTLGYWREYRTLFHLAATWGLHESTACRIVHHVEEVLAHSRVFRLPGKQALPMAGPDREVIVVDATETPIERPKKGQRRYYSGRKKRHTLKAQLVVDRSTAKILCTAHGRGPQHDFALYRDSRLAVAPHTKLLGDSGYQGVAALHANSQTPQKKPRGQPLPPAAKRENRALARVRIVVEHVIRRLKIFRILLDRYRNRRRRFGLRFNLIAGIYNYELAA